MESMPMICPAIDEQQENERKQRVMSCSDSDKFCTCENGDSFLFRKFRKRELVLLVLAGLAMFAGIFLAGIGIGNAIK